jgi:hypothetical protein
MYLRARRARASPARPTRIGPGGAGGRMRRRLGPDVVVSKCASAASAPRASLARASVPIRAMPPRGMRCGSGKKCLMQRQPDGSRRTIRRRSVDSKEQNAPAPRVLAPLSHHRNRSMRPTACVDSAGRTRLRRGMSSICRPLYLSWLRSRWAKRVRQCLRLIARSRPTARLPREAATASRFRWGHQRRDHLRRRSTAPTGARWS